jgi:hypothetical protein
MLSLIMLTRFECGPPNRQSKPGDKAAVIGSHKTALDATMQFVPLAVSTAGACKGETSIIPMTKVSFFITVLLSAVVVYFEMTIAMWKAAKCQRHVLPVLSIQVLSSNSVTLRRSLLLRQALTPRSSVDYTSGF